MKREKLLRRLRRKERMVRRKPNVLARVVKGTVSKEPTHDICQKDNICLAFEFLKNVNESPAHIERLSKGV